MNCDIFMFDLTTQQWHDVKVKDLNRVNTSRRNHCGALIGDWMIVYGGLNTCVQYLDDLQAFNFITLTWSQIETLGTLRPPALCRSAARTVFHKQRKEQLIENLNKFPPLDWSKVDQNLKIEGMFMYGGQMSNGDASSDLWVLRSLKKGLSWVNGDKICEGKGPGPRFDHAM